MALQKSFAGNALGVLYLVATPIGNLQDITFRALEVFKEVSVIACEDTRQTIKLLNHFQIQKKLLSYHEHNKEKIGEQILRLLLNGEKIALVSDAGTPAISDPGYDLVSLVLKHEIPVISIPGANAALTALIASGLLPYPFIFYGFLPREEKEAKKELERIKDYPETLVFYEAPHRLKKRLGEMFKTLGDRKLVLARELTKRYEEYYRGSLGEWLEEVEESEIRGEYTVILSGATHDKETESKWWEELTIIDHVHYYLKKGYSKSEAIKLTANDRGVKKNDLYREFHLNEEK